ncbi:MAG: BREX-1 system adenine-specific DNA-methyltransferase PglX [Bacteroidetes bacterium]|nr:BREX-1 system adenine-specific DNA-methyltransferase PglX [Bacteroidota bacterium]
MKLADHVEHIRQLIDTAFRNRLGRMGITAKTLQPVETIHADYHAERKRIEAIREVWIAETRSAAEAYEKLVEEFTFTLFNRLSALKVMEAHTLHPEIVTRRSQHGDRSFAHRHWLEQNPDGRNLEAEGLVGFLEDQLSALAGDIPLFSPQYPYHLLPTAIELNGIISAFNQIEGDAQVEEAIWQSDDVLGWLYESYNNTKKAAHKESGDKTEYNKVSIQSQVYTPRWVVKFLVDNSLGKLYLEMYPDSEIRNHYKIANLSKTRTREPKPLTEIKLIDPATGSGNFLLYGFDLFYDLYTDQIENYGADYDERNLPELIITHNLHGIDLDDRAIQLAQLGLYIKAKRKKRSARIEHFNVVSSDFYLPEYAAVKHLFEGDKPLSPELERIVTDLWTDLQQAYKFGALIRLEEKFSIRLHGLVQQFGQFQIGFFDEQTLASYDGFRENFFANLQKAVVQNTAKQGQSFLNTKTQDAITFLQLLTQKYDVAVANPPYTDSSDFGPDLKNFVETNYRQPYKFNTNLYATFIKRCYELTNEQGKMALIHPLTFMYISSFEDVRRFLLEKTTIDLFVEFGLGGVFTSKVDVDVCAYVIKKVPTKNHESFFMNLQDYKGLKVKRSIFEEAYIDYLNSHHNKHNFKLNQEKLKIIEGWPFIYWISDGFREKFRGESIDANFKPTVGLMTGNNDKYLRFHWEVIKSDISENYSIDKKKWIPYQKGGEYNKWYGNNWLIVNYSNNGIELASRTNKNFYFKPGVTYSATSSKGVSYRVLPPNQIFDIKGSCVFPVSDEGNILYSCALLNSKLATYIISCLNATVETQTGDVKRIPFIKPPQLLEDNIAALAGENVEIKKQLNSYRIIETNYQQNPLSAFSEASLRDRLLSFLNFENARLTQVLLNEAVINELIFKVYELSEEDRLQVETKMGKPVGQLGITKEASTNYEREMTNGEIKLNPIVLEHVKKLPVIEFDEEKKRQIVSEFGALYQSNNDLEEFCIRHQVNPVNVWSWFKESRVLPQARAAEIALEFLADAFRSILMADEDGMVPLVGLPGEPRLYDRFEAYCYENGFTSAQIMQIDGLLGRPVGEYIEQFFFEDLCNLLNIFRHLPKTPFIWHLSSGEHQGFEVYIIIYKWNRDSLYKLKSSYLSKRTESLQFRLQHLGDSLTAQAQSEKETIRLQLQEIDRFAQKLDELIAEGYDPKLDDGVGKNIAPLQKKGLLRAEVLKSAGKNSQLEKYLKADW